MHDRLWFDLGWDAQGLDLTGYAPENGPAYGCITLFFRTHNGKTQLG